MFEREDLFPARRATLGLIQNWDCSVPRQEKVVKVLNFVAPRALTEDELAACIALLDQAAFDLALAELIAERTAAAWYVGPRDADGNALEPFNLDHYKYSGVDEPTHRT